MNNQIVPIAFFVTIAFFVLAIVFLNSNKPVEVETIDTAPEVTAIEPEEVEGTIRGTPPLVVVRPVISVRPVVKPRPRPKPKPRYRPKPKPRYKPKPKPKPKPSVSFHFYTGSANAGPKDMNKFLRGLIGDHEGAK